MYLKKLELVGFKSFPEKTQFVYNRGMTSIVGPNGCGKSNLLDALRWVLGEQKTSLLRGAKMEEVIFAGTRALKPLGMAEVSLHIDNKDGMLPTQYGELVVTRRLFRSGESEYLINKAPCRLKDITDLFADTGIGAHAYAIIQQEMVDAILSDKTEERRFLFEEAAGITRYKHRKKAAERKLAATEQDLTRLQDILGEVTTHVRSLKRQVNKAKRYKDVSEELKSWDLFNTRGRFEALTEQLREFALTKKSLEDRKLGVDAQLDSQFANLEESRRAVADLDNELSQIGTRIYELSEKAHLEETAISVKREKKENLAQSITQNHDDIEALNKRADVIRDEKSGSTGKLEDLNSDIEKYAHELEQAIISQREADNKYLHFRSMTEDDSSLLVNIEGRLSSGKTDSLNIENQTQDLTAQTETQNNRKSGLIEEKLRRREEIASIQTRIETARTEAEQNILDIESKEKDLNQSIEDADSLRDQLAETSSGYEATMARKNLLTEMIENYEGFAGGVAAVFEVANRWVDITGTVADCIRPRPEYQIAIEAALGDAAQYIICSNSDTAQEAISYLQNKKAGRATFLILDSLPESLNRPDLPFSDYTIGWADSLVECNERHNRLLPSLLGRTAVCENLSSAQTLIKQLPSGFRVVTTEGHILSNEGFISGGASEDVSLLGRKNEVEGLELRLQNLENYSRQIRNKQAEVTLTVGELRQSISQLNNKHANAKDNIAEMISRLKEEQFKINAADEVITSIEQQVNQFAEKLDQLRHRQYALTLDFDELDKEKEGLTTQAKNKKEKLTDLEDASHAADKEVNRLQVVKVELESKRSQIQSQLEYYEEMLKDIAGNNEQKKAQIEDAEKSIVDLSNELESGETSLKELFNNRQRETETQQSLRLKRDELDGQLAIIESQAKSLRSEKEQITDSLHSTEIKKTELSSHLEQLEERIREEYGIDIGELQIDSPNSELSQEQALEHVEMMRENLRKMGIVNLLALEEYDEQKQRQEFLSKQLDDLISAKATLRSTIQKINKTAKAMFLETIHKARENFKQMYQELFTGGEADVLLEDESDPLESKIEIISRPRGKKPLSITQLSGGERALTAISLLFALYMVKPSPFCFLDEIDAPLDDVNVSRFLKIVQKFAKQTQFIIITHNKITMEASNTIYGVTMEEPGVSKVVAVRFKKESEDDDTILELHYADDDTSQQAG